MGNNHNSDHYNADHYSHANQNTESLKLKVDGFIDFDGTLVTSRSHFALHKIGAGYSPLKWMELAYSGPLCIFKDRFGADNSPELADLARVLAGLDFNYAAEKIIGKMELNPNLHKVKQHIDKEFISLAVLSKNDSDLIQHAVDYFANGLHTQYGIVIEGIVANHYEKIDGIYTGKAEIIVAGNKQKFFDGKYFFADKQDSWRYKNYDKFVALD